MNTSYLKNKNITTWANTCEYLVLHHTASIGDGNIKVLAGLTTRQVSVHYLVRQDWSTYHFVDENKIAWHCGESSYEWKTNLNNYSIGIEVESDWIFFSTLQKQAVNELIKNIISRRPNIKIIRHKDIAPKRKTDIWDNFWSKEYETFEDYINQFDEKYKLIKEIMKLNSKLWGITNNEETKTRLNNLNDYFRKQGF